MGVATLVLAHMYPNAQIVAVEPAEGLHLPCSLENEGLPHGAILLCQLFVSKYVQGPTIQSLPASECPHRHKKCICNCLEIAGWGHAVLVVLVYVQAIANC